MTVGTPSGRPGWLRYAILGLVLALVAAILVAPDDLWSRIASGPSPKVNPVIRSTESATEQVIVIPPGQPIPGGPQETVVVLPPGQPIPTTTPVVQYSGIETVYDAPVVWLGLKDGSVRQFVVHRPGTGQPPPEEGKPVGITPVVMLSTYGVDNAVQVELNQSATETWTWEATIYVGESKDVSIGVIKIQLVGDTTVKVLANTGIMVSDEDYRADRLPTH